MLPIVLHFAILLLSILFRLASALRLTIPLMYAPTLFSGWYCSHQALAEGLWWALVGLSLPGLGCIPPAEPGPVQAQ